MQLFENNEELEKRRCHEIFVDISFGAMCGVLTRKKLAGKLATLQKEYINNLKSLAMDNLNEIELSDWNLDYSDGEQRLIKCFTRSSKKEKIERIKLLGDQSLFSGKKVEDVFEFEIGVSHYDIVMSATQKLESDGKLPKLPNSK